MYGTIISVEELNTLRLNAANMVVVDCRFSLASEHWGKDEYLRSHIPGARYAHLNNDLSGPVTPGVTGRHPLPDQEAFTQWLEQAGVSNGTQLIAYDQGPGGIAARFWWLMKWMGHDAVAVLNGGWSAWQASGMPETSEIPEPGKGTFVAHCRNELLVTTGEIAGWCHDPSHAIVDSRASRRYSGEEEMIDPVAGHIPGAVNLPFAENVNPNGTWKSPTELKERFTGLLKDKDAMDIAFYCGSGVTACHNLLALSYAGLGNAKLYPGSWSEWICDTHRKIELS